MFYTKFWQIYSNKWSIVISFQHTYVLCIPLKMNSNICNSVCKLLTYVLRILFSLWSWLGTNITRTQMQIQIQTQIQIVIWVDMHLCIPPIYLFVLDDAKREGFLVPPTPRATKFNIFLFILHFRLLLTYYFCHEKSHFWVKKVGTGNP